MKGNIKGLCNRSACLSPDDVLWYNHSTRKYYCNRCASRLNKANARDAERLYGHELCTMHRLTVVDGVEGYYGCSQCGTPLSQDDIDSDTCPHCSRCSNPETSDLCEAVC